MSFYLKQKVYIEGQEYIAYGIIQGKLESNAYVVFVQSVRKRNARLFGYWSEDAKGWKTMKNKYGSPIRHTELEWGGFVGSDQEMIVPEKDIRLV